MTVTVKLSRPIIIGEGDKAQTYTEFTFREAEMGDFIAGEVVAASAGAQGSRTASLIGTLASMANVPYAVMKKISPTDFQRVDRETQALVGNAEEEDGTS